MVGDDSIVPAPIPANTHPRRYPLANQGGKQPCPRQHRVPGTRRVSTGMQNGADIEMMWGGDVGWRRASAATKSLVLLLPYQRAPLSAAMTLVPVVAVVWYYNQEERDVRGPELQWWAERRRWRGRRR
jgi:hypothetical protein